MKEQYLGALPFKGAACLRHRPFGTSGRDLYVDFHQAAPYLSTQILQSCIGHEDGHALDPNFFWDLAFGKRVAWLMVVLGASGVKELDFQFPCSRCGEDMEVEVGLHELVQLELENEGGDTVEIPVEQGCITLRKPTGRDQKTWLSHRYASQTEAVLAMVQHLQVGEVLTDLSPDWLPAVEDAMADADPLVNFILTTWCPHCGVENTFEPGLEALLLARFHKAQTALLYAVHRLASYYNWSEDHILALPAWRRDAYLNLAAREAGG